MLNQCSRNDLTLYLSAFEKPKQKPKNKNIFFLCAMAYFILLSMRLTMPFLLVCFIKLYFQRLIAALMDP